MQVLLGLALPHGNDVVPLLDWSAGRILDVIFTDDRRKKGESVSQLLSLDPALLLWAVCKSTEFESWHSLSPRKIGVDLLSRFDSLLAESTVVFPVHDEMLLAEIHRLQCAAVNLARHARQLSDSENGMLNDAAYTLGMLANADRWVFPLQRRSDDTDRCHGTFELPTWIRMFQQEMDTMGPAIRSIAKLMKRAKLIAANSPTLISDAERKSWNCEFPLIRTLFPKVLGRQTKNKERQIDYQKRLEQEKLNSLQQLAYGASHEINNPLTNISTRAQTLMHDEADPERRRQLATITSQAYRAHEMIADMMLFAKPPAPQKARVDLTKLLRDTITSMKSDVDLMFTEIEFAADNDSAESGPIEAEVDPAQIDVAVRAIVKNSAEAIHGAGHVEISARKVEADNRIEICIQDNGQGISAELRRHIFDPFFSGREAGRGLGFGLSKAWRILQQHQGDILVSSEVGVGTTFTIRLPS